MRRLAILSSAFRRREDGNATIEFVIVVPMILTLFMMSVEAGWFMVKSVMLDRAVYNVNRDLLLNRMALPNANAIKDAICDQSVILTDCRSSIRLELRPINQATWTMPPTGVRCINRDEPLARPDIRDIGGNNDIMLMRVCLLTDPLFPTTGIGASLVRPGGGNEIGLISVQAFVNEPNN